MSAATNGTATPSFDYVGTTNGGKKVKGTLEAASMNSAQAKLTADGVWITELHEHVQGTGLSMEIRLPGSGGGRVKDKDLAMMNRQLATMVGAGVSLLRAITVVGQQSNSKLLQETMRDVQAQVEQGSAFSVALSRHPKIFPPIMISMVEAGELGGFLDKALVAVADNFEKSVKLRGQIKSAMTYPVVVLCIAVAAVIFMLIFIVPVFENIFSSFGSQLPAITQLLVNISHAMPFASPVLIVGGVVFAMWWRSNHNKAEFRARVDPIKLKIPVFGRLLHLIAISRFARNFATMVTAGVPMMQSLEIVGKTSGNMVVEQALNRTQEGIRRGQPLSTLLAAEPIFPDMLVQMLAVGEDSGAVDTMLNKIADFYDDEVESTTKQLSAMMEPMTIVFLAGIVGFMIVALYMPMFTMYGAISGN